MKLQHIFTICFLIFGLLCPVSAKPLSKEKIAFSSNRDGNWEIYMMNPDGTRQERLTYDRAVDCDPVISPTGAQILFNSNRGGTRDLIKNTVSKPRLSRRGCRYRPLVLDPGVV